jgi:hypothetical protein
VTFEAQANSLEGSLHPFSIYTRLSHLKIKAPGFYFAPREPLPWPVTADKTATVEVPANRTGLNVLAQAWLFPNQGSVHWAAFAADVVFLEGAPAPGSHVKILAELVNDSIGGIVETWSQEQEWPGPGSRAPSFHWQGEAYIYPGSYVLRVIANDTASGKTANATDTFIARPLNVYAFRFSSIVLAEGCLLQSEQAAHRNLFDPLRWEGCKLAPAAAGHFRAWDTPLMLLRIYPPKPKLAEVVKQQWKAYAVVDNADDKAVNLQISAAEVRGLAVTGKLPFKSLNVAPGPHDLKVLLTVPGQNATTQVLPLHTKFWIEP